MGRPCHSLSMCKTTNGAAPCGPQWMQVGVSCTSALSPSQAACCSAILCDAADSKAVSLQQNPLFAPHSHGLVHALGGTELVLSFLHPCVKEALEAKDAATRELLDTTCRLNAAATVLMHATNMHLPAAIGNAHTCTELAVLASQDALKHWCAANATVMQRLLHHPPLSGAEFQLFKDFVEFMS